jgi:hypothetical protein
LSGPPHETYMHGVVVRDGEHRGCLLACQRSRPQLFSRAVNIGVERLDIADALSCAINNFGGPSMYSTKIIHTGPLSQAVSLARPEQIQVKQASSALEYTPHNTHNVVLRCLLLLHRHRLLYARAPCLRRHTVGELPLPHTAVDVDILELDEHGAVDGALEPAVSLPAEVQDDEQGAGEVELEESLGVEVRAADRVQGDVELGDEGDGVDEDADVGAVDAEGGLVGELVEGVAVCFPVKS